MKIRALFLLVSALYLVSCASYFKRKACEDTNWFEYGQKVAESGQNLENDQFISECRKVEAQIAEAQLDQGFKKGREVYCNAEGAFATGKKGEIFSTTMCEGYNLKVLRARYKEGVHEYCQPENGEPVGASGQVYKKVCPKNLESEFLKEYKIGRKKYLEALIEQKEDELTDLDRDIRRLEYQREEVLHRARLAEASSTEMVTETVLDPRTGRYRQVTTRKDDPTKKTQVNQIRGEADDLERQVRTKEAQREQTRKEIRNLKIEARTL